MFQSLRYGAAMITCEGVYFVLIMEPSWAMIKLATVHYSYNVLIMEPSWAMFKLATVHYSIIVILRAKTG